MSAALPISTAAKRLTNSPTITPPPWGLRSFTSSLPHGKNRRNETLVVTPRPTLLGSVGRFMLGSVAAILVVVVGGFFALRSVAVGEAERQTREQVVVQGRLVQSAGLTD